MARMIDYANPSYTDELDDVSLQRYFVYAWQKRSMQAVRFGIQARGLANLAYVLRVNQFWPQFIVVAPPQQISEPPEIGYYIDEAAKRGDVASRSRLEQISRDTPGGRPFELISDLYVCGAIERSSLSRRLLLHTPHGFRAAGVAAVLLNEAAMGLAKWSLGAGIANAIIALLLMYGLNVAKSLTLLSGGIIACFLLAPGVAILVLGFDQMKYHRRTPVLATVIGSTVVLWLFMLGVRKIVIVGTIDVPELFLGLLLLAFNGMYLALAIRAVREQPSI